MSQIYRAGSTPDGYEGMIKAATASEARAYMADRFERPRRSITCRKATEAEIQDWRAEGLRIIND